MTKPISAVVARIVKLLEAIDVTQLKGRVCCVDLGDGWCIAINGARTATDVPDWRGCMGVTLEPFSFAVWWQGWLAGLLSPFDGVMAAGSAANEDTLLAALEKATAHPSSVTWELLGVASVVTEER